MNDYILIFIVAAYICVGVFVVVWMDNEYFDRKHDNKSVAGWWWKMAIWPVLVPRTCLCGEPNLLETPLVLEYHGHAGCATAVAFFADKHAQNIGFFEVCVTRVTKSFFKTIDY